jgi:micrococcal nuclease
MVKLIGVSTPEANDPEERVRKFGLAAADFTQNMVEGKDIRIKYFHQPDNTDGRALASIYLMDGTSLNCEIIKRGYGRADAACTSGDVELFREYEREARENKRGLWAETSEE